jgi:hypothetical protein
MYGRAVAIGRTFRLQIHSVPLFEVRKLTAMVTHMLESLRTCSIRLELIAGDALGEWNLAP